ncbi:MAG: hypothetical protein GDA50_02460 [Alphaproteobacteria bacterium GM202ARS2]|nr:hypothetical protein [Alphaproteobacteria bacterium GM202ARS2]
MTRIRDTSFLQPQVQKHLQKEGDIYVSKRGRIVQAQKKKANFLARFFLGRKVTVVYRSLSATGTRTINKKHLLSHEDSRKAINAFLKEHATQTFGGNNNNRISGRNLLAREKAIRHIVDTLPSQSPKNEPVKSASLAIAIGFINLLRDNPNTLVQTNASASTKPDLPTIPE